MEINEEEVLDALGTFSIFDDSGEISVFGPTAASEVYHCCVFGFLPHHDPFLQYFLKQDPRLLPNLMQDTYESPMSLPADLVLLSALFPFPPDPLPLKKLDEFVPHLPSFKTAVSLSDSYFTHFAWWYDAFANPHIP